jgi:hypothetical protein
VGDILRSVKSISLKLVQPCVKNRDFLQGWLTGGKPKADLPDKGKVIDIQA